jgi:hypothetical protein
VVVVVVVMMMITVSPWCMTFLKELIFSQMVKKFSAFM